MSRHNIVGSEAFDRSPSVYVRNVQRSRRRGGGAIVAIVVLGTGLMAALGFLGMAIGQAAGLF